MCDRFHKLPSELMREDYGDLMRIWSLLTQYEAAANKISEQRSKKR